MKLLSKHDQDRLLALKWQPKHRLIILLMLEAGLRVSEVTSLRIEDFNFRAKSLKVKTLKQKKEAYREIPLSGSLYATLAEYLQRSGITEGYLLPSMRSKSGHLERRNVAKLLQTRANKLGIERLHPHLLRHTFASVTYARTKDVVLVKTLLGHRSYNSTIIYTHIPQDELRRAIQHNAVRTFWQRLFGVRSKPERIINIATAQARLIGRNDELKRIDDLLAKKQNIILLGPVGVGKKAILRHIDTSSNKVIKIDGLYSLKATLLEMLLYLYTGDKQAIADLLYGDIGQQELKKKLQRFSVEHLASEVVKLTQVKEYVLVIYSADSIDKKAVVFVERLKDHFTIITSAREVSIRYQSAFWNFERVEIGNLPRSYAIELIKNKIAEYALTPTNYDALVEHVLTQSGHNPRAICEMIHRYSYEPVLDMSVISSIKHDGARREYDMTIVVIVALLVLASMRYLSGELTSPVLRLLSVTAIVLLLLFRQYGRVLKRTKL